MTISAPQDSPRRRRLTRVLVGAGLALLAGALVTACVQARKLTYPPGFVYLERKQVVNRMAEMSLYLRQIEDILGDNTIISSAQQAEIIGLLNRIDGVTDELGAGNVQTNHLLIDQYIDAFRADLAQALRSASADPPSYFEVGMLAGSCGACHQRR